MSKVQGYLAHKKTPPPPPGPPKGPRHRLTVGSWEGAFFYERGTPVPLYWDACGDRGTGLPRSSESLFRIIPPP